MKILFIIPGLSIGGQEKIGMMLTSCLQQYHEVVTVCFSAEAPDEYPYSTRIVRIENKVYANPLLKMYTVFKRALALRKFKKQYQPDVSISIGETAIAANAFTYTKEIKIASLHQSVVFFNGLKPFYRKAYTLHDHIIPVSKGINAELKEIYGIDNQLYIHNGYDIGAIVKGAAEPLPPNLTGFFDHQVIAHLGRFDLPKGHWHLVMVFVKIKETIPDARLLLIGDYQNNDIFSFCMDYLEKHGMKTGFLEADNDLSGVDVLITGHQSNPFRLLKHATLFAFPSIWEGFGNALVESMACGLPVVSADCPTGPREIIGPIDDDAAAGILLPAFPLDFSPAGISFSGLHIQWASKIISLLNNEEELAAWSKRSLQRCHHFTIAKSCASWRKVIEMPRAML